MNPHQDHARRPISLPLASFRAPLAMVILAALTLLPSRVTSAQETIDFESLPAGTILSTVFGNGGSGPILVAGHNPELARGVNAAVIFDSSNASGNDEDLGTPNEDFGGPGDGGGGEAGSPYQNDTALGNILIVAEDLIDNDGDMLVDDPDDEEDAGCTLSFDFSALGTVTVNEITIIDVDNNRPPATVDLLDPSGATLTTFTLPQVGNNGVAAVPLGPTAGVASMVVTLGGSGAIDNIVFTPPSAPPVMADQLWFPNRDDGTISILEPNGDVAGTFDGSPLSSPTGVAIGTSGTAWVVFRDSDALVRFDDLGASAPIMVGSQPASVAIDRDGNAWISNFADGTLSKIAGDGTVLLGGSGSPPVGPGAGSNGPAVVVGAGPRGIAVDAQNSIYVVSSTAAMLTKLDSAGQVILTKTLPAGSDPRGVAVDRLGFVWVTLRAAGAVERRASDGSLVQQFAIPGAGPEGITIRGVDEAWVAGSEDGHIYRLRPGQTPATFAAGDEPSGILTDGKGFLWVTDRTAGTASRFDGDGNLVTTVTIGSGPGFLGDASGMAQANVLHPAEDFDGDGFPNTLEVDTEADPFDGTDSPPQQPSFVPPISNLICNVSVQDVALSWSNPAPNPYDSIQILRDDALQATLPMGAETYSEPAPLAVGTHGYQVIGTEGSQQSIAATCEIAIGGGGIAASHTIEANGTAASIFDITANPNASPGEPVYYLTDPAGFIYGTDASYNVLVTLNSPFQGIAPTTGIAYAADGDAGLGSLMVAAGPNGDPLQVATVVEISLAGDTLGDPFILTLPAAGVGTLQISGGLGGLTYKQESGVYMAFAPENCELYAFRKSTSGGSLLQEANVLPEASAALPGGGYGLNGVYLPDYSTFDENGGRVRVSGLSAGGSYQIEEFMIQGGSAVQIGDPLPLGAASAENSFGGFVLGGDQFAVVGLTTNTVYELESAFFVRGDVDDGGMIDIADAVQILSACFGGYPFNDCIDAYDIDDDGVLTITDGIMLLDYLFSFSTPPAAPFPNPGPDPTPDALPCL